MLIDKDYGIEVPTRTFLYYYTLREKYLTDLNSIPEEDKSFATLLNQIMNNALTSPGKLKRVMSGWYFVMVGRRLMEITTIEDGYWKGQWIAKEHNNEGSHDYVAPCDTLKEVKYHLELTKKRPWSL